MDKDINKVIKLVKSNRNPNDQYYLDCLVDKILNLVNIDEITYVYCKNPFSEMDKIEIYIFTTNKKLLITKISQDKKRIDINLLNLKDILSLTYNLSLTSTRDSNLDIVFKNEQKLVLNSKYDSNESWDDKYTIFIEQVYKLLINL